MVSISFYGVEEETWGALQELFKTFRVLNI